MDCMASSVVCLLLLKAGPTGVLTSPSFPVTLSSLSGQPVGRPEPPWIWPSWTWVLDVCGSLHVRCNRGPDQAQLFIQREAQSICGIWN